MSVAGVPVLVNARYIGSGAGTPRVLSRGSP
jgi:hypothetical protein